MTSLSPKVVPKPTPVLPIGVDNGPNNRFECLLYLLSKESRTAMEPTNVFLIKQDLKDLYAYSRMASRVRNVVREDIREEFESLSQLVNAVFKEDVRPMTDPNDTNGEEVADGPENTGGLLTRTERVDAWNGLNVSVPTPQWIGTPHWLADKLSNSYTQLNKHLKKWFPSQDMVGFKDKIEEMVEAFARTKFWREVREKSSSDDEPSSSGQK